MKTKTSFFALITMIITFLSCEGSRYAKGYVKDQITFEPIDSVFVDVISSRTSSYTDSTGFFYAHNNFGGCVPECEDIHIRFSKEGYDTLRVRNPSDNEIIYLQPIN